MASFNIVAALITFFMKRSDKKAFVIFIVVFAGLLILIHGNEIGLLRNTHKADAILGPILYVACLIFILLFFRVIEFLKTLKIKEKILTTSLFLSRVIGSHPVNAFPSRDGVVNPGFREHLCFFAKKFLPSFPLEKVMCLKLCKTNLGMIIVDRYYDSIP